MDYFFSVSFLSSGFCCIYCQPFTFFHFPYTILSGNGILNGCPLLFSHHFLSKRTLSLDFLCIYFALFLWPLHVPALHFPPLHCSFCVLWPAVLQGSFSFKDSTMANESLRFTDFAGSIFHTSCLIGPFYFLLNATLTTISERKVLTFQDTVITKHYHAWK